MLPPLVISAVEIPFALSGFRFVELLSSFSVRSLSADRAIFCMTEPTKTQGSYLAISVPMPDRESFGRRKSLVSGRMNFLDGLAATKQPRSNRREAPRPIVGNYDGSWDDRETPSFFNRLRRVLG